MTSGPYLRGLAGTKGCKPSQKIGFGYILLRPPEIKDIRKICSHGALISFWENCAIEVSANTLLHIASRKEVLDECHRDIVVSFSSGSGRRLALFHRACGAGVGRSSGLA
jgi:hypothetical protein